MSPVVGGTMAIDLPDYMSTQNAGRTQAGRTIETEIVDITAADKGSSRGFFYRPAGKAPKTAVIMMHPRVNMTRHFLALPIASSGYAFLGCASRWENNDADALQEATLLDIAAAVKTLKDRYGIQRVVSVGHSGGGGLFAFYQGQATTTPPGRLTSAPSGDPPDLNAFEMLPLDAMVLLNAHKGEGHFFIESVDPAVVDESDPLATLGDVDMYDPCNGYRTPPEPSKYSAEFLARYRAAQRERNARLDAVAYGIIAAQRAAQQRLGSAQFSSLDAGEQMRVRRTAYADRYLVIYRTYANPMFTDLSIDPSDRRVMANAEPANYVRGSVARIMTPRGFLSTWSGLSSRMMTDANIAKSTVPTLLVVGTADELICGLEYYRTSFAAAAAKDKQLVWIKGGDHSLLPIEPVAGGRDTQAEAANAIIEWLRARFPVS